MTAPAEPPYGPNSEAVRAHLNILQGIISRMARNSVTCKTWCVTLVAAIMVLVARTDTPAYAFISFVPAFLFLVLDTYYLGLERAFRKLHKSFVKKLHRSGKVELNELYAFKRARFKVRVIPKVLSSWAIWPFYGALIVAISLTCLVAFLCT